MNGPVVIVTDLRQPGARQELERLQAAHAGRTLTEFLAVRCLATTFFPGRYTGDPKEQHTLDPTGLLERNADAPS